MAWKLRKKRKTAIYVVNKVGIKTSPYQNTFFQVHFFKLMTVLARKTTGGRRVEHEEVKRTAEMTEG